VDLVAEEERRLRARGLNDITVASPEDDLFDAVCASPLSAVFARPVLGAGQARKKSRAELGGSATQDQHAFEVGAAFDQRDHALGRVEVGDEVRARLAGGGGENVGAATVRMP
jgi:hypothetical protein